MKKTLAIAVACALLLTVTAFAGTGYDQGLTTGPTKITIKGECTVTTGSAVASTSPLTNPGGPYSVSTKVTAAVKDVQTQQMSVVSDLGTNQASLSYFFPSEIQFAGSTHSFSSSANGTWSGAVQVVYP